MKNIIYKISSLFLLAMVFQSCEDVEVVEVPNFTVTPITVTAKAGEPVEFNVDSAPNFLRYYSGEFGHEYKHRERTNAEGVVSMSFLNAQKWGLGANATGTFSVWYSQDYDGSGAPESVNAATWTEISDRFNISELYSFTLQESGIVDITDLADGKPIFFGFKYFSDIVDDRGAEWHFDGLSITMDVEGAPAPLTIATESSPGFMRVDVQGVVASWNQSKWYWDSGKGLWRMRGNQPNNPGIINEDWLITNSINLTKVSPDESVNLKAYSTLLNSFTHTYSEAGTYTITVVGNNTTVYGHKEKVQEFEIVVTE